VNDVQTKAEVSQGATTRYLVRLASSFELALPAATRHPHLCCSNWTSNPTPTLTPHLNTCYASTCHTLCLSGWRGWGCPWVSPSTPSPSTVNMTIPTRCMHARTQHNAATAAIPSFGCQLPATTV